LLSTFVPFARVSSGRENIHMVINYKGVILLKTDNFNQTSKKHEIRGKP
jgi:hypothetical protein